MLVLEDLGSRFGVRVNGLPLRETRATLKHGDELIFGAAEAEPLRVVNQRLELCFSRPNPMPISSQDASLVDRVTAATSFFVAEEHPVGSKNLSLALALGIPVVTGSFLTRLFSDRAWPREGEFRPAVLQAFRLDPLLLSEFALMDLTDPDLRLIADAFGGGQSGPGKIAIGKASGEYPAIPEETFHRCILASDATEMGALARHFVRTAGKRPAPPVEEAPNVEWVHRAGDDGPDIEMAPIGTLQHSAAAAPVYGDGEVKTIVSYANLGRPRPGPAAAATAAAAPNFKVFKKIQPPRRGFECIGLSDMRTHRSHMETGVNSSKKEEWLSREEGLFKKEEGLPKREEWLSSKEKGLSSKEKGLSDKEEGLSKGSGREEGFSRTAPPAKTGRHFEAMELDDADMAVPRPASEAVPEGSKFRSSFFANSLRFD